MRSFCIFDSLSGIIDLSFLPCLNIFLVPFRLEFSSQLLICQLLCLVTFSSSSSFSLLSIDC